VNSSHKHHIMIGVTLKDSIQHGYWRIFAGVCHVIKKLKAVGCQQIKIILRGKYHKSTNDNDCN